MIFVEVIACAVVAVIVLPIAAALGQAGAARLRAWGESKLPRR